MAESRAWDWEQTTDSKWLNPCEESYYYARLWKKEGRQTILDLGCGLGRHAVLFAREGFHVTAADLSQAAVDHVDAWQKREGLSICTKRCDMHMLPFDDNSFDGIWAYHSVSHTDTAGFSQICAELTRVLKPNGALYITMCAKEHWGFLFGGARLDENTVLVSNGTTEINVPHYYIDYDDIPRIFSGFSIQRVYKIFDYTRKNGLPCHYLIYAVVQKSADGMDAASLPK